MSPSHSQSPSDSETPGADRFWGQFSQAGRGREEAPEPEPDTGAGREDARPDPEGRTARDDQSGPGDGGDPSGVHGECLEWCPICRSAELIRNAVTPELREQAESLQREAMTVFQAFLAAYSEKTGGDRAGGESAETGKPPEPAPDPDITDIPLD